MQASQVLTSPTAPQTHPNNLTIIRKLRDMRLRMWHVPCFSAVTWKRQDLKPNFVGPSTRGCQGLPTKASVHVASHREPAWELFLLPCRRKPSSSCLPCVSLCFPQGSDQRCLHFIERRGNYHWLSTIIFRAPCGHFEECYLFHTLHFAFCSISWMKKMRVKFSISISQTGPMISIIWRAG